MRYPLIAFLIVFVIPPYTAHALMAGKARLDPKPHAPAETTIPGSIQDVRSHHWKLSTVSH